MKTQEQWMLNSIIDSDQCAKCGTCTILCPNNILTFDDGPKLTDKCLRKGRGTCHEVCPRVSSGGYQISIREKLKLDRYTTELSQEDALIKIIHYLIDEDEIDGAIIVGSDHWKSLSLIVKDKNDLTNDGVNRYKSSTLSALEELGNLDLKKIAIAALPCQINGFRKIQHFEILAKHDLETSSFGKPVKIPEIKYLIGEYCSGKYEYDDMNKVLKDENIALEDVKKFEMQSPNLVIETSKKTHKIPLKPIRMNNACKLCNDYEAKLADISLGVGSDDSTSVIIRKDSLDCMKDVLKLKPDTIDVSKEKRERKLKRFELEVKRREENNEPISYYWNGDYAGVGNQADGGKFIKLKAGKSGWYTTDDIEKILDISNKFNLKIKMTNRGAYELHDAKAKDVKSIIEYIHKKGLSTGSEGPVVRTTMSCPGSKNCKHGIIDSPSIASKLEEKFSEYPAPYKVKFAVSGCPNQCTRPSIHDIGVIGKRFTKINTEKCVNCGRCLEVCKLEAISYKEHAIRDESKCNNCGVCFGACPQNAIELIKEEFEVTLGGKSGRQIVEGRVVDITDIDDLLVFTEKTLITYNKLAIKPHRERMADTIERIGFENFLEEVKKVELE